MYEYEETCGRLLGWGLKKWVLTRRDMWHIDNIFWDTYSSSWYIKATPIAEKDKERWVDFHVTTRYMKKCIGNKKLYTLAD